MVVPSYLKAVVKQWYQSEGLRIQNIWQSPFFLTQINLSIWIILFQIKAFLVEVFLGESHQLNCDSGLLDKSYLFWCEGLLGD